MLRQAILASKQQADSSASPGATLGQPDLAVGPVPAGSTNMPSSNAPAAVTTETENMYTPDEFDKIMSQSRRATEDYMLRAANFIVDRLNRRNIPHAVMGGFSFVLRGSPRRTADVDFAVGCGMEMVRTVLGSEAR